MSHLDFVASHHSVPLEGVSVNDRNRFANDLPLWKRGIEGDLSEGIDLKIPPNPPFSKGGDVVTKKSTATGRRRMLLRGLEPRRPTSWRVIDPSVSGQEVEK